MKRGKRLEILFIVLMLGISTIGAISAATETFTLSCESRSCTVYGDDARGPFYIRDYVNKKAAAAGYKTTGSAYYFDDATAKKICQLIGYSKVVSYSCTAPGYENRCNYFSCGDDVLSKWDASINNFREIGSCGGQWINTITCSRCIPKTCSELGAQCGTIDNECGTQINCGDCNYCTTNPSPVKTSEDNKWFSNDDIYYAANTKPSDDSCGYYADAPTANRVCQLKGYDGISSWTPQYNFYSSPGDNCMLKWNGNSFDRIPAESYNTGVDTVTCQKTVYCYPQCIGKRPTDSDGCGGTCSACLVEKKCVVNKCTTDTSCLENQTILKINTATKLGALWNESSSLSTVCFSEIFNKYYTENVFHNCTGDNNLLNLKELSESKVSNSSEGFNVPVCFGNLTCRAVNSTISMGLVASYSFEGNAEDNSGFSNDGINNGATFVDGKTGLGVSLNGSGSYIYNPVVNLPSGNIMSVSAWIYPMELQKDSSYNGIVSWGPRTCTGSSFLLSLQKNGRVSMASWCNDFVPTSGPVVNFNQWNHVVAVLNGNTVTLYVNGQSASGTLTSAPNVKSTSLAIGSTDYPGRYFNGTIDEVKIWNRVLSPEEIQNEYQGTNPYCESDEKVIAKMSDFTNAFITKANEAVYPIQLCCKNFKKIIIPSPPMFSNVTWQDMLGNNITTADVNDTVKMVVFRQDLLLKNVNYQVFKERTCSLSDPLDCVLQFFGDVRIAQEQSRGYRTIRINETGNYYFTAKAEDSTDVATSNTLAITSPQVNNVPVISIVKPIEESKFVINTNGKTDAISFEQNATDKDDDLSVTWDFNDGYMIKKENCLTGGNCNATYQYNTSAAGTRMITAEAKESTRYNPQSEYDIKRIYVYKPGLVLFPIIDSPDYRIKVFNPGTVRFDGTSTHVANCTYSLSECNLPGKGSGSCFTINNGPNISCYKFAESATDSGFIFEWTIDGDVEEDHTTPAPFERLFPYGGRHEIRLKVTYTY